jgi:putative Holliday junction resolvase
MRYLGIDYGRKRIGVAVSDPDGRMAFPHSTVRTPEEAAAIAKREGVGAVVIGLPIPFRAQPSAQTRAVRAFAARLKRALQLPMAFENEVFTTKLAERHTPEENADASAAALILQSYLDRKKHEARIMNTVRP